MVKPGRFGLSSRSSMAPARRGGWLAVGVVDDRVDRRRVGLLGRPAVAAAVSVGARGASRRRGCLRRARPPRRLRRSRSRLRRRPAPRPPPGRPLRCLPPPPRRRLRASSPESGAALPRRRLGGCLGRPATGAPFVGARPPGPRRSALGGRLRPVLARPARPERVLAPAREVRLEVVGADEVLDVEERRALQPDVDEGGLQPGKHPGHLAEVDVADGSACGRARPGVRCGARR